MTGYYFGAAINTVHHTGYVPGTSFNSEQYSLGGKVFGGYRFAEWAQVEVAYHHLGQVSFDEGLPVASRERSQSISASFVWLSYPVSTWLFPTFVPVRVLLRAGMAYKHINHSSVVGNFNEGVGAGLVGFGLEHELAPNLSLRTEYEFLTTAIGGTSRVLNVMNTPLSVSVAVRF